MRALGGDAADLGMADQGPGRGPARGALGIAAGVEDPVETLEVDEAGREVCNPVAPLVGEIARAQLLELAFVIAGGGDRAERRAVIVGDIRRREGARSEQRAVLGGQEPERRAGGRGQAGRQDRDILRGGMADRNAMALAPGGEAGQMDRFAWKGCASEPSPDR